MHCAKFGLNWPGGSGDEDENVKSLQTANDGQQVIRTAKQEAHGPHCSPEKPVQINEYI